MIVVLYLLSCACIDVMYDYSVTFYQMLYFAH